MKLFVNKKEIDTPCVTMAELVASENLPEKGVAVAVDNKMVPRSEWNNFCLAEGQQITIVKAFCGG